MKILMVNKFLYPNGGSETYMFTLGEQLTKMGHEVQYFGMEHEGRVVGNRVNAYTSDMNFHGGSKLAKLTYPLKTIYSGEARKKLRLVLEDFQPDVVHLNNFNYQLTPSVILEVEAWRKQTGRSCRMIYTAHDYQLVCPNHMLYRPEEGRTCEACIGGHYESCMKHRCIHGSRARSALGMLEAKYWNGRNTYALIDRIICCSAFMKEKLDTNPVFGNKTAALHNFVADDLPQAREKRPYVLYFGRFAAEKGMDMLLAACRELPEVLFVFAGSGPMEGELAGEPNVKYVGFQQGDALKKLIAEARFTVYPSVWYENCPLSVMESIASGTPVIGARIGGIPELIEDGKTGLLFESGNVQELTKQIRRLWDDAALRASCEAACRAQHFDTAEEYARKLLTYYAG